MDALVFDTGPLAHFARAGWLGVLKSLVGSRRAIIPVQVAAELRRATRDEHAIGAVLDAQWIGHYELRTEAELRAFAGFAAHLMSEGRNEGETAVLAVAATMPAQAVLDDSAAHKAAQSAGVACKRTLALLCEAVVGFEQLGAMTGKPPENLKQMLSPQGDPGAGSLFEVIACILRHEGLALQVRTVREERDGEDREVVESVPAR